MDMRAGQFDQRITILSPTTVIDPLGAERQTWATVVQLRAHKAEIGARELVRNPQISADLDAVYKIRHPGLALNSAMRIRDSAGRLYQISGLTELPGRRQGFEIRAKALDKTGATLP
jgi:SPP1 family predicted phage head-tail adaptor